MNQATRAPYDPPGWDVVSSRLLGATVLRPFWGGWVQRLGLQGGESVLDYGSGSGQLSRRLALAVGPLGRVNCVDVSPRWSELARKELAGLSWAEVRLGTPAELPPGGYDLVHVHYVLHGLPRGRRGEVLAGLAPRLKPGGRLAFCEPLYYGTLELAELLALCRRVGLRVIEGPTRRWWLAGPVVEVVLGLS